MDVLNEQQLHSVVIDPALTRIRDEIIPAARQAIEDEISGALPRVNKIVQDAISAAGTTAEHAVAELRELVASLDGWTLDITIPPISIRLTRPKS